QLRQARVDTKMFHSVTAGGLSFLFSPFWVTFAIVTLCTSPLTPVILTQVKEFLTITRRKTCDPCLLDRMDRSSLLRHRVALRCFVEPGGAQLRRALLRLEVHVDQPEAVAVPINPFEVVLRTPEEVPLHRHAIGRRTLELREVRAQKHD